MKYKIEGFCLLNLNYDFLKDYFYLMRGKFDF